MNFAFLNFCFAELSNGRDKALARLYFQYEATLRARHTLDFDGKSYLFVCNRTMLPFIHYAEIILILQMLSLT